MTHSDVEIVPAVYNVSFYQTKFSMVFFNILLSAVRTMKKTFFMRTLPPYRPRVLFLHLYILYTVTSV